MTDTTLTTTRKRLSTPRVTMANTKAVPKSIKKLHARPRRESGLPTRSKSASTLLREEAAAIKATRAACRGTFQQDRMERQGLTASLESTLTRLAELVPNQEAMPGTPLAVQLDAERRVLAGIYGSRRQELITKLRSVSPQTAEYDPASWRFELAETTLKLALLKRRQGEFGRYEELLASALHQSQKLPFVQQLRLHDLGLPTEQAKTVHQE